MSAALGCSFLAATDRDDEGTRGRLRGGKGNDSPFVGGCTAQWNVLLREATGGSVRFRFSWSVVRLHFCFCKSMPRLCAPRFCQRQSVSLAVCVFAVGLRPAALVGVLRYSLFFFSQRSQCVLSHVEDGILLRVCDFRKCAAAWPYRRKRKSFQASQQKKKYSWIMREK